MRKDIKIIEFILRLGVFGTFIGHGYLALSAKPEWIHLITAFGFSKGAAISLLPIIGIADIAVAFFALLKPVRIILIWAMIWAFAAGLSRIVAGESMWEFVERFAEWGSPLALFVLQGVPRRVKLSFRSRRSREKNLSKLNPALGVIGVQTNA